MPPLKLAVLIAMIIIVAGGTIILAKAAWGAGMPIWAAAAGPVLLGLTLFVHLKKRRK